VSSWCTVPSNLDLDGIVREGTAWLNCREMGDRDGAKPPIHADLNRSVALSRQRPTGMPNDSRVLIDYVVTTWLVELTKYQKDCSLRWRRREL